MLRNNRIYKYVLLFGQNHQVFCNNFVRIKNMFGKHGNLRALKSEREGKRECEREGEEFKYEQKRARYFSPALTVQTDCYPDLGGKQRPFSLFFIIPLWFPWKRKLSRKYEKLYKDYEKLPADIWNADSLVKFKIRVSGGRGRKCV